MQDRSRLVLSYRKTFPKPGSNHYHYLQISFSSSKKTNFVNFDLNGNQLKTVWAWKYFQLEAAYHEALLYFVITFVNTASHYVPYVKTKNACYNWKVVIQKFQKKNKKYTGKANEWNCNWKKHIFKQVVYNFSSICYLYLHWCPWKM